MLLQLRSKNVTARDNHWSMSAINALRGNIMGVDSLDQFIEEMNPNCS